MNLENFKVPHLFKEILTITVGFAFLVYISFHSSYGLAQILNNPLIKGSNLFIFFITITISYFIGKMFIIINDFNSLILNLIVKIFKKNERTMISKYFENIFIYEFFGQNTKENFAGTNPFGEEILMHLEKNENLKNEYFRLEYHKFFINLFIGGCITTCFIAFNYYLILIILAMMIYGSIKSFDGFLFRLRIQKVNKD